MIGKLIVTLMLFSILFGAAEGNLDKVSAAALSSCSSAVELIITLAGSMALWGGVMRVAEKSGITALCAKLLSPLTGFLFKGIEKNPAAEKAVNMNIIANLFGLGNAATPLGIAAVKELNKENDRYARRHTAMLVVLNTASIQLIPTTIAAIRMAHGAVSPFDITLPILVTSFVSAAVACITAHALYLTEVKSYARR